MRRLVLIFALAAFAAPMVKAQDPLKAYPANYKLIFDNAEIAVVRVHYGPHERLGVHNHSNYPTVYVYLNDSGEVRFSHDETPPFVMTRPAVQAGSFRVSPGRVERHTVENLSDQPSEYLRIELKRLPLRGTLHPQRVGAPTTLTPGDTEEFQSSELTIHRIICQAGVTCAEGVSQNPILLVALAPSTITALPALATTPLQPGAVLWQEPSQALNVRAATQTPAHLLQIELHRSSR